MDTFPLFPPIFWNVVRRGSDSFEFYLLVCVIRLECHSIRGHSPCAKRLDRGETLKHHFQTDAVASSWLNQSRDDRKSKTRPRNKPSDHQTNQSGRSRQNESRVNIYHEASVTSYVYEIRPKIRGPFDGCLTSPDLSKYLVRECPDGLLDA